MVAIMIVNRTSESMERISNIISKPFFQFMRLLPCYISFFLILSLFHRISTEIIFNQNAFFESDGKPEQLQIKKTSFTTFTFQQFKKKYARIYTSPTEEQYRQQIFNANLRKLNDHNLLQNRTYNMKPTIFLDLSQTEFKTIYTNTYPSNNASQAISSTILNQSHGTPLCYNNSLKKNESQSTSKIPYLNQNVASKIVMINSQETPTSNQFLSQMSNVKNIVSNLKNDPVTVRKLTADCNYDQMLLKNIADTEYNQLNSKVISNQLIDSKLDRLVKKVNIDWTMYSGNVKYQGNCGACYAFTTVDTVAALNAINTFGFFVPLSIQQIVDCVDNGLTFGCNGGFLQGSYTYVQLKGITTEYSYPYTSAIKGKAGKCKASGGPFKVSSFIQIKEGDCKTVINKLIKGPISVGIAGYGFQFYDEGVFSDCSQNLDHAVVLVGYKSGVGWKIKNSWGTEWGIQGYGWLAQGNTCGICNMAVAAEL